MRKPTNALTRETFTAAQGRTMSSRGVGAEGGGMPVASIFDLTGNADQDGLTAHQNHLGVLVIEPVLIW